MAGRPCSYGCKTLLLCSEDHALAASSTGGTRRKDLSLRLKGPVLTPRRTCPYARKVLSFQVDHHGDPPNTPWSICQPSIVSRLTLYSLSPYPL